MYQVVWLSIVRCKRPFEGKGPLEHWLLAIAKGTALAHRARLRKRSGRELPLERGDGDAERPEISVLPDAWKSDAIWGDLDPDLVLAAVAELPEGQRAALELHLWENLRFREVAEQLGVAEGTIKSHVARARNALRQQLQADAAD